MSLRCVHAVLVLILLPFFAGCASSGDWPADVPSPLADLAELSDSRIHETPLAINRRSWSSVPGTQAVAEMEAYYEAAYAGKDVADLFEDRVHIDFTASSNDVGVERVTAWVDSEHSASVDAVFRWAVHHIDPSTSRSTIQWMHETLEGKGIGRRYFDRGTLMIKRATSPNIYFVELALAEHQESRSCGLAGASKNDFEAMRQALGAAGFERLSESNAPYERWTAQGPSVELSLVTQQGIVRGCHAVVGADDAGQLAIAIAQVAQLAAPDAPLAVASWIRGAFQSSLPNSRMFARAIVSTSLAPAQSDPRGPRMYQIGLAYPDRQIDEIWLPLVEDDLLED